MSRLSNKQYIENIEKEILENVPPIRLQGYYISRLPKTLHEFLYQFFHKLNEEHDTIYVSNRELQTEANMRRSLGDIFMICKYYFKKCKLIDVLKILYSDLFEEGWRTSYCFEVKKRMWYYDEEDDSGIFDKNKEDEYGYTYDWYKNKIK